MTPTRARTLVVLVVVAGILSWAVTRAWAAYDPGLVDVPWAAPALLALVAVAVFVAAASLRGRLRGEPGRRPVPALGAARFAVLAKAVSHAGALLAGAYAGFGVYLLPELTSGSRSDRVLTAGGTVLAALLLVAAGLVLERVCRVPPPGRADATGGPDTQTGRGSGGQGA